VNIIETRGLGKCYGGSWALRDCTLEVSAGQLAALVGPNGAGKTTLMNMLAGLASPTDGSATVLGSQVPGSPAALDAVAFVAQDAPVYPNLLVADMVHLTRNLNRYFDQRYARARLAELEIPLKKKAGQLSGGQQAQLALTLALARRPRLLILDEPLSALDPLARRDFLTTVLTAMADDGISVLLSSHSLPELDRVADYVVVLTRGRLRLAGGIDDLLSHHRLLTGPATEVDSCARQVRVVQVQRAEAQAHLLVETSDPDDPVPPGWEAHPVSSEELLLAYLRDQGKAGLASPSRLQPAESAQGAR